MPKPSSPDLSKFAQLKTKALNAKGLKSKALNTGALKAKALRVRPSALAREKGPLPLVIANVAIIAVITSLALAVSYRHPIATSLPSTPASPESSQPQVSSTPSASAPSDQPSVNAPAFINLQPTVDAWLKTTTANVGLMIYDLDNDKVAASYQADRVFDVASVYKLFFVYDGYRQIESGAIDPDLRYVTTSDYRAGTYTYAQCLDLMVRESYNGCADKMRSDRKAYARVESLIEELDLTNTTGAGLSSTTTDIATLLKLYYEHPDLSAQNWQKLSDSMLNQPATKVDSKTTYDWRQGLPSGFSKQVNVYDKVGWAWDEDDKLWTTYADAAIVEFPAQNRHYIVVVLTSGLPDRNASAISRLGARIEDAVISSDASL